MLRAEKEASGDAAIRRGVCPRTKPGRARVFGLSAVGYKYGPKSNDMHSRHMKYSSGPAT